MDERDEIYDADRAERLADLLREIARQIRALDASGALLSDPATLMRLLGEARSELFHYEVRSTYDTPERAEHRRIVRDAGSGWDPSRDPPDDEDQPWRREDLS